MENINLRSIKRESVRAIFNAIAGDEKVSRADISAQTGLSLMTVGKVVDALLNLNIVCQSKEIKSVAGRKAGLININEDYFCVILDLTSSRFVMVVIDIHLGVVDKMIYDYDENLKFYENLLVFVRNSRHSVERNLNMKMCIGIGASLPGAYDSDTDSMLNSRIPELMNINVKALISMLFPKDEVYVDSSVNVAALSNIKRVHDYQKKIILYWFVGDNSTAGAVVANGEILHGAHQGAGNFGKMIVSHDKELESLILKMKHDEDTLVYELSKSICNAVNVLDPHVIILENEVYPDTNILISDIRTSLTDKFSVPAKRIPEFITGGCKFRHSHRGLAIKLREKWLDNIIKCQI